MEKKIYVVGLDSDSKKTKAEETVKAISGVNSVIANCDKAQILVDFDETNAETENKIISVLEQMELTVLN